MKPVPVIHGVDLDDLSEVFIPMKDLIKIIRHRMNERERWCKRPWGKYKVISEGPGFTVKHLVVHPGGKTSIQSHEGREEFWTVAEGIATIVYGDDMSSISSTTRRKGASFHVPHGKIHRIQNDELEDLHIVEIWSGKVLSEDDIKRYQDSYGRV